jgi:hypothetical protein
VDAAPYNTIHAAPEVRTKIISVWYDTLAEACVQVTIQRYSVEHSTLMARIHARGTRKSTVIHKAVQNRCDSSVCDGSVRNGARRDGSSAVRS